MGEFSVCQFFEDGSYEYVRNAVDAKEAVDAAMHYATSVGARMGVTHRVIITDGGDCIAWEWKREEGITFGADPKHLGKLKLGQREPA
jgi:hypothetical protein